MPTKETEAELTEVEREALRIARHAHTTECLGRSLASPRRSDFDAGFIAGMRFHSEREQALRDALTEAGEDMFEASVALARSDERSPHADEAREARGRILVALEATHA
jgi:hypothetical protein